MSANPFQKAQKQQLKARVAFAGPTGSGKTFSALEWATILADQGTIAVVDTEHGSASLYADLFDFDVLTWAPPYDPGKLAETIVQAETAGYAVVVLDSMSHFWEGEGGTLDIADAAGQRSGGNSFAGWKIATPALRHLIDTMLGCDMHVIGTMRSKMEYVLEEDSRGKKVPKKVGMAPVMRAGVEYEFTMVGDIDLEHRILFTKSRCSALADVMVQPGRAADAAKTFVDWLQSGVPSVPRVAMVPTAAAKTELLTALAGDRVTAKRLWDLNFGDVQEVPRIDLTAIVANLPEDPGPDPVPGVPADGPAVGPEHAGDGGVVDSPAAPPPLDVHEVSEASTATHVSDSGAGAAPTAPAPRPPADEPPRIATGKPTPASDRPMGETDRRKIFKLVAEWLPKFGDETPAAWEARKRAALIDLAADCGQQVESRTQISKVTAGRLIGMLEEAVA